MRAPRPSHALLAVCTRRPSSEPVRFAGRRFAEAFEHAFDGRARGDFAEVVAAYAVGKHKKPAVRAHALGRRRSDVPEIVFVSLRALCRDQKVV